ncbi:helicase HerA domain-containing protein [Alicyclobacillus acidocaldarius]|uniref:helicase HerA domain-containing protein n=1 Tax=Alicyclobacillus acidocaldarius TaxID=405212 RepID=UPI001FE10AB3|nr:DUF87 domain-containing protein [Alicyclobacillus acidocaldarius]
MLKDPQRTNQIEEHQAPSTSPEPKPSERWRPGKIQTRPFWVDFKFGEIQTRPFGLGGGRTKQKVGSLQPAEVWLRLLPAANGRQSESLVQKLATAAGGETVHFRVTCDDKGHLALWLGGPASRLDAMRSAFLQRCPGADAQEAILPETNGQVERKLRRVGVLGGWLSTDAELEPVLDALQPGVTLDIGFASRPQDAWTAPIRAALEGKSASSSSRLLKTFFESAPDETRKKEKETREERMRRERLEKALSERTTYYQVEITVTGPDARRVDAVVDELNIQLRHDHHLTARPAQGEETIALWREEELSCLVRMPNLAAAVGRRIPALQAGEVLLRDDELTEGIAVGRLIHPLKEARLVCIPTHTFLQHFALFGKTGSGKSATALMMIQSLLDEWVKRPKGQATGLTYIDPKQESVLNIMNRLLHLEQQGYPVDWSRVHYLSFGDGFPFDIPNEYPVGLNLLDRSGGLDVDDIADAVTSLLHAVYAGDTPLTDKLIKNAVRTLLDDTRTHSILALTYLYECPAFRERIQITDPLVRRFWRTTGESVKTSQLEAATNRLETLIGKERNRRIFGQLSMPFRLRQWMDEGHIVLIDIKNVDPINVKIIMGYLLNRYYVEAKTRTPNGSLPHMLMIDEAHNVQIPVIEKIIAETRAFGLSIGIITQFPEQLRNEIYKAISENVATIIACGVGPESAGIISVFQNRRFAPEILQGLPELVSCVYTKISGMGERAFKAKSDPPVIYLPDGRPAQYRTKEMDVAQRWAIDKILELQRRDCRHVSEVDQEIKEYLEWLESFMDEEVDDDTQPKKPSVKKKYEPTDDELPILEALVALVEEEGRWEGRTSALLEALEELGADVEEWSPKEFGKLLGRAEDWLREQGISSESARVRTGTEWRFERL